jgi:DDE_Tnp_1-associated
MALVFPVAPPGPPGSLAEVLATVPEPRHPRGWPPQRSPLPLVGILQLAVAAMLCGCRSLYAVAHWGHDRLEEDPAALVPLGLPVGRSPSHPTLHRIFAVLDASAFERALGQWLAASGVEPTDALAIDGKTLRGIHGDAVPGVHLVAAYAHHAGAVMAEAPSPGKGQELAAVKPVLGEPGVGGRTVTGDALLTQRDVCIRIVAGGGDYLVPVDENQPALLAAVEAAFSPLDGDRSGRVGTADDRPVAGGGTGPPRWGDDGGDGR